MKHDMTCIHCQGTWCNDESLYKCPHCGNDDSFEMLGEYQCDIIQPKNKEVSE